MHISICFGWDAGLRLKQKSKKRTQSVEKIRALWTGPQVQTWSAAFKLLFHASAIDAIHHSQNDEERKNDAKKRGGGGGSSPSERTSPVYTLVLVSRVSPALFWFLEAHSRDHTFARKQPPPR